MTCNIIDFSSGKSNPILLDMIKAHSKFINLVIDCKSRLAKQKYNKEIGLSIYNLLLENHNAKFCDGCSPLDEEEAVKKIIDKMVPFTRCRRQRQKKSNDLFQYNEPPIKVLHGYTFNDFAKIQNKDKMIMDLLPLHIPDLYFNKHHKKYKLVNDKITIHKNYIQKATTTDKCKFYKGKNHYVDGYCYSSPYEKSEDLFIIDYKSMGKTDLIFKIAGTKESTSVKIRKVHSEHPLLKDSEVIKKLNNHKINRGGNARMHHNSFVRNKHFMFSMFHHAKNDDRTESVPVEEWNSMEPHSLSAEKFAKMLESAMSLQFRKTLNEIKELEKDEKVNVLGEYGHSIDISVNLVNAPHFDMGDAGYGIGLWLSSDGKPNPNWYFILPNASIEGSKGVAIKLDHGIMIEWNGTEIKHCSSDPDYNSNQTLFGTFIGPKRKYCSSFKGKPEAEPLIPKFDDFVRDFKKAFKNNK